jgi:hypothetical protein
MFAPVCMYRMFHCVLLHISARNCSDILGSFLFEIVDILLFDVRVVWASLIVRHSQKHKGVNEVTVMAFDKY